MLVFIDYTYLHVGGSQQLETCLICELNKRGMKVKVYCSKESFLYNRLISLHADFIHLDSDIISYHNLGKDIQTDDVVCITDISRALLLFFYRNYIKRVFFYSIHPDTFFYGKPWMKKIPN